MNIKKYSGFILLIPFILTNCKTPDIDSKSNCKTPDIDPKVRPDEYTLDYWVAETIKPENLKHECVYERGDRFISYLDSSYLSIKNPDGDIDFRNKKYVSYDLYIKDDGYTVSSVFIKDPEIKIYGLGMSSTETEINDTLSKNGFEYLGDYSGLDPSYLKDDVEFRIYPNYILISYRLIKT